MINIKNNGTDEITLVEYSHIVLKAGDNGLELSARRLEIAKKEIEERGLPIEITEETEAEEIEQENSDEEKTTGEQKNADKSKNKRKEEHSET